MDQTYARPYADTEFMAWLQIMSAHDNLAPLMGQVGTFRTPSWLLCADRACIAHHESIVCHLQSNFW